MNFIDRKDELKSLTALVTGKRPCLINMYGRRRIGKTSLLKELHYQIKPHLAIVYYVFNYETSKVQLDKLYKKVLRDYPELFTAQTLGITSWEELFRILFSTPKDLILFLDEFSFIVEIEHSIPSIIQHLWDEYKDQTKLKLLVCGSLVSIMQDLMGSKQPLYGRFTHIVHLKQLAFKDARLFFQEKSLSFENELLMYGLFGGIPYYLQYLANYNFRKISEILIQGPFSKYSPFREEIPIELRTFTRSFNPYFSILIAIANGKTKFSEITAAIRITTDITRHLDTLIKLDIIERRTSTWVSKKGGTRYYIKDSFYRFWFKYFHPFTNELSLVPPEEFYKAYVEPTLSDFFGFSFEKLCSEFLIEMGSAGKLQEPIGNVEKYTGQYYDPSTKESTEIEIDIVASGINKKILVIAECKWWTKDINFTEIENLRLKVDKFSFLHSVKVNKYASIEKWFFTKNPVNEHLLKQNSDIKFINIQDMELFYNQLNK